MEGKLFTMSTEQARAVAACRRAKVRVCHICGGTFTTKGRGLYDSPTCKRRAEYIRYQKQQPHP